MKYAQILNDKVHWIGEYDTPPEFNESVGLFIDVTELEEQPKEGWSYNSENQSFLTNEEVINYLYIYLAMTDGDGRKPLGIKNDGIDSLGIVATFRQTEDPESVVIEVITDMSWRVTIRESSGSIYDIIDVIFTNGIASLNYVTTNKTSICDIKESDFEKITFGGTEYTLKLIGDTTFKVYRQL